METVEKRIMATIFKSIAFFPILACCSILSAQNIEGLWKRINRETGNTQCVISIYEHQGKYFGRIIGTYNAEGKMKESLHQPVDRAEKVPGTPFYCGMDLILNLQEKGSKYKGMIIDPRSGRFYDSSVWVQDGKLIVRGELLCFGKKETWFPVDEEDFPSDFEPPNISEFIPVIPTKN